MLDGDKTITGVLGNVLASYGPRMRVGEDEVLAVPEGKAEFWGVYRHHSDGTAEWVADANDADGAAVIAPIIAKRSDPATLGFLVSGYNRAFEATSGRRAGVAAIEEIADYAPELDHAVAGRERHLNGCFAYEVAYPFGFWLASVSMQGHPLPGREAATQKLADLVGALID